MLDAWRRRTPSRTCARPPRSRGCGRRRSRRRSRDVEVVYQPAGKRLARVGGAPLEHLYVIRKGVGAARARRPDPAAPRGGRDLRLHLAPHRARRRSTSSSRRISSRTGCRQRAFRALLGDARLRGPLRGRAGGAAAGEPRAVRRSPPFGRTSSGAVGQLVRRPAVWVDEGATVGDAARAMSGGGDLVGAGAGGRRRGSSRTVTSATACSPTTWARRRAVTAIVLAAAADRGARRRPSTRRGGRSSTRACTTCPSRATARSSGCSRATDLLRSTPPRGRWRCSASVERLPSRASAAGLRAHGRGDGRRRSSAAGLDATVDRRLRRAAERRPRCAAS